MAQGVIAIMGSGETTDSMVRVHRFLLSRLKPPIRAVFIDTPAGFQMNAEDLYLKAREYFAKRLNQNLDLVSFRSSQIPRLEAERAFRTLREADYIFVGPGSPTYALRHWVGTAIPAILGERIENGACLVAASAAALTLGRFTIPVYEIYKVGEEVRWVEGLNLLGRFGFPAVVIPHWNNAEGGTHDTRFCYMGEPRLRQLESLLPEGTPILGIDEHTCCILDLGERKIRIRGIGSVTLRYRKAERVFLDGETIPLEEWLGRSSAEKAGEEPGASSSAKAPEPLLQELRESRKRFDELLSRHEGAALIDLLIRLDKLIWKSCREFEEEEKIAQAREEFRAMIVALGLRFDESPKDLPSLLRPWIDLLLEVREKLRLARQFGLADEIRERLSTQGIIVEDTPEGTRWRMK
jgi:peptidase E